MKKILFIDRDGTIIKEHETFQIDRFDKLVFYPKVFEFLGKISKELDYKLVMVSNQDGLGTDSYPEEDFNIIQNFILKTLKNEGIEFDDILIDNSFPEDNKPTRKPGIGLLNSYLNNKNFDIKNSFVIGDRLTDMEFAFNIGCNGIFINNNDNLGIKELKTKNFRNNIILNTTDWEKIYKKLLLFDRTTSITRNTNETKIDIKINLDGKGVSDINTGIDFFDHMLEQLSKHGNIDLFIKANGDLNIDEHHTIEDTAIALGEAINSALGKKSGISRYGFTLPMDDSLASVSIDFGGRSWLEWEVTFKREMIGKMPTEMFFHFFKSFCDSAKTNLNIKATGSNEHHKIESIFKSFSKAIKMAISKNLNNMSLPTTKGKL
tara:strand:- start:2380 stop:3510 length:1131 start_codon:yes stop_codon:yes gene_type:complete